ncbi:hypothetical protein A6U85_06560 [Agrobacterium sp. 13-626]|nr:hypothetical protein CN09_10735 [Rhizobium rhizogenes]MQB29131.1 hypothetical protein [Rhizobium rhizogenes]OCJ06593.1 hypothetical protein A6U85_06560 [Agrobacterium sp. 13-626]
MFEFLHHGQFSFIATRPATLATQYRTISSANMNFDSYFIEIDQHISDFIYKNCTIHSKKDRFFYSLHWHEENNPISIIPNQEIISFKP